MNKKTKGGSSYYEQITRQYDFPSRSFEVREGRLFFHGLDLQKIAAHYGTPLRFSYLPHIGSQIKKAQDLFKESIRSLNYEGSYTYCYCTKTSYFPFLMEEVFRNKDVHLEISSAQDIPIVRALHQGKKIDKDRYILANGHKISNYWQGLSDLIQDGFSRCIPILDELGELDHYENTLSQPYSVGIRIATHDPGFPFHTSRLGIRDTDIVSLYREKIVPSRAELRMLHFFLNKGIRDEAKVWAELERLVQIYCDLRKLEKNLTILDIGGGMPIQDSLGFSFDYSRVIHKIVQTIQKVCAKNRVPCPDIFTEFGTYTVGESEGVLYSVVGEKQQGDKESWYLIDGSLMTHIPDVWGEKKKFLILPVNGWNREAHKTNVGGLTCDSLDYFSSDLNSSEVLLPKNQPTDPMLLGFFHTGAYQNFLVGFGGVNHCLIPSPQHVIFRATEEGISEEVFRPEQTTNQILSSLGYSGGKS
ncbi:MAG: arginine decarboxylase [Cytophagales bacterium]|nr:arginine decarboxylase [Cytophagales bacterium]